MSKLKCPHCQEITTTLSLDTNTKLDGSITRRRRCSNCQERFNTTERYADVSCIASEDLNFFSKQRILALALINELNALDRQTDRQTDHLLTYSKSIAVLFV
jgi:transcriptional regulator NrdR family protein